NHLIAAKVLQAEPASLGLQLLQGSQSRSGCCGSGHFRHVLSVCVGVVGQWTNPLQFPQKWEGDVWNILEIIASDTMPSCSRHSLFMSSSFLVCHPKDTIAFNPDLGFMPGLISSCSCNTHQQTQGAFAVEHFTVI